MNDRWSFLKDTGKWGAIGGGIGALLIYVLSSHQAAQAASGCDVVAAIGGCVVAAAVACAAALRKKAN